MVVATIRGLAGLMLASVIVDLIVGVWVTGAWFMDIPQASPAT